MLFVIMCHPELVEGRHINIALFGYFYSLPLLDNRSLKGVDMFWDRFADWFVNRAHPLLVLLTWLLFFGVILLFAGWELYWIAHIPGVLFTWIIPERYIQFWVATALCALIVVMLALMTTCCHLEDRGCRYRG